MNSIVLPDLILLDSYENNLAIYLEEVYTAFVQDFIKTVPCYKNKALCLKKHPMINGKEATFWHLITSGKVAESDREYDLLRCERIKWPKPIINNAHIAENIKIWENRRSTKGGIQENTCICFGDWEYLIVLRERKGYLMLWTAYPVVLNNEKRRFQKEYNKYISTS